MASGLEIIAEDKFVISYRPKFTALTDSALSAILLQEMIYFWVHNDKKPFYKFRAACKHKSYKAGDSWCETLGFNKHEFDTALKAIGTKIKKGISKADVLNTEYPERKDGETSKDYYARYTSALKACIVYWTDSSRITWYTVNENLLGKFIDAIYLDNSTGARYLKSCILADTQKNSWEQRILSSKVTTKATAKDSTKEKKKEKQSDLPILSRSTDPSPVTSAPLKGNFDSSSQGQKPKNGSEPPSPTYAIPLSTTIDAPLPHHGKIVTTPHEAWAAVKATAQLRLDEDGYKTYLEPTILIDFDADTHTFEIMTDRPLASRWCRDKLGKMLKNICWDVVHHEPVLIFKSKEDYLAPAAAEPPPASPDAEQEQIAS